MPDMTGVRQTTLNWPGAVSLSSRYAGRISCACADEDANSIASTMPAIIHLELLPTHHCTPNPEATAVADGAGAARWFSGGLGSNRVYLARMS